MVALAGDTSPFGSDPLAEVPLPRAPLVRVLCQVRWPNVTALQASQFDSVAEKVGLRIAGEYPLGEPQQEMQVVLTPDGVSQQAAGRSFRFRSPDDRWRIVLSDSFVALEASQYTSRADFCSRLRDVLEAISSVVAIPFAVRIGYRYTNRLEGDEDLASLPSLVKDAVLGGHSVPLNNAATVVHTLTETLYAIGDIRLLARWAHLPPNVTIDPTVPAVAAGSWILDLDAFREDRIDFDPTKLADQANTLSAAAYRFFRWATNDEFLRRFGGQL
jgi:uncharacterized protein (TIGR04255 family)